MEGHRWNKVRQRLSGITAPGLVISFNNNPVRRKYRCGKYTVAYFQIKLDGEVIWRFPKDSKQYDRRHLIPCSHLGEEWYIESPVGTIVNYLDLHRDRLLDYEDIVGLSDVLKVCDRRIGYNRLKNLELSDVAKKIFDARFKNKNHENNRKFNF